MRPPREDSIPTPPSFTQSTNMSWETITPPTPISSYDANLQRMRNSFETGKLDSVDFRLEQLRALYFKIYDNLDLIYDAVTKDLHRPKFETELTEVLFVKDEFNVVINNLREWVKETKVANPGGPFLLANPRTRPVPLGVVLAITPWNYPVMLNISPVVGAIASGCPIVLKMSELSPHTSACLGKLFTETLDPDIIQVVYGGVPETTALLAQKWDKIMYTGNGTVGRIVAQAAVKHLTPLALELGGKSPVFITSNCSDVMLAARRIVWGKFVNAGQICVAPDYILVAPEKEAELVACIKEVLQDRYGTVRDSKHPDLSHIISKPHWKRLHNMVANTKGDIQAGGLEWADEEAKFLQPTIVSNVPDDDILMKDEIFGPIIPIIKPRTLGQQVDYVTKHHDTPLAMYIFSDDAKEIDFLQRKIRAGSVNINEVIEQVGVASLPLGGVGSSGSGAYHGKFSFDCFTHKQAVMGQPTYKIFEKAMYYRYPPYSEFNMKVLRLLFPPVHIARTGKPDASVLARIFGKKVVWLIVVAIAAYAKRNDLLILFAQAMALFLK